MKTLVSRLTLAAVLTTGPGGLLPAPAWGQTTITASPPVEVFGAAERRRALEAVIARIDKGYVHMDERASIIARLRESDRKGRYGTGSPIEFAERVTQDFDAVTHDSHLYLKYLPDWYAAALEAEKLGAPGKESAAEKENAFEQEVARYTNYGLMEMKILPGNIRYLRIEGFDWIEGESNIAYDGAMRFLKGGAAIIIDLRGNTGGWTQSARYLISHFLAGDTLYATWRFADGTEVQQRTADYVPAGRIKGTPLFLLVDHRTRSAAEQVAYSLQQFKTAEVVGKTTAGASYTTDDTAIPPGFLLSVSMSEVVDAVTRTSWERVGVKPTVDVDPHTALEVAELRAIDTLLPNAQGIGKDQLLWARPSIQSAMNPVNVAESELRKWAGTYGAVSLAVRSGALWLTRPNRDPNRLKAMNNEGLFEAVDVDGLRVRVNGKTLEIMRIDSSANQVFANSSQ